MALINLNWPSSSYAFFVYCQFHCALPCMQLQGLQKRLSGIIGMEQWNEIMEWNTIIYISLSFFHCGAVAHNIPNIR